jgi:hypothetical protein
MRVKWLIAAVGLAVSLYSKPVPAQVLTNKGPLIAANLAWRQALPPQPATLTVLPTRTRAKVQVPAQLQDLKSLSTEFPKPGVYTTTPYTCVIIVPDARIDEQFVVRPTAPPSSMPVLKPELHFVPFGSK